MLEIHQTFTAILFQKYRHWSNFSYFRDGCFQSIFYDWMLLWFSLLIFPFPVENLIFILFSDLLKIVRIQRMPCPLYLNLRLYNSFLLSKDSSSKNKGGISYIASLLCFKSKLPHNSAKLILIISKIPQKHISIHPPSNLMANDHSWFPFCTKNKPIILNINQDWEYYQQLHPISPVIISTSTLQGN